MGLFKKSVIHDNDRTINELTSYTVTWKIQGNGLNATKVF